MTWHSHVCIVNVNSVIVDDSSEKLLVFIIEEKGSMANLNGTGLCKYWSSSSQHFSVAQDPQPPLQSCQNS